MARGGRIVRGRRTDITDITAKNDLSIVLYNSSTKPPPRRAAAQRADRLMVHQATMYDSVDDQGYVTNGTDVDPTKDEMTDRMWCPDGVRGVDAADANALCVPCGGAAPGIATSMAIVPYGVAAPTLGSGCAGTTSTGNRCNRAPNRTLGGKQYCWYHIFQHNALRGEGDGDGDAVYMCCATNLNGARCARPAKSIFGTQCYCTQHFGMVTKNQHVVEVTRAGGRDRSYPPAGTITKRYAPYNLVNHGIVRLNVFDGPDEPLTGCPVCLGAYAKILRDKSASIVVAQCGHHTCSVCHENIMCTSQRCPLCRNSLSKARAPTYRKNESGPQEAFEVAIVLKQQVMYA